MMMRKTIINSTNIYTSTYHIDDLKDFKIRMLNWAKQFNIFCFLDSNEYRHQNPSFDFCLAAGSHSSIVLEPGKAFTQLKKFYDQQPRWLFGHLGYGLKNEVEALPHNKKAAIDFGLGYFFEPEILLIIQHDQLQISSFQDSNDDIYHQILHCIISVAAKNAEPPHIIPELNRKTYLQKLEKLKTHIARGDCYEINFCRQFTVDNYDPDPLDLFLKLNEVSPNPFAAFYKLNHAYCICASPERFLKKQGDQIISQPIKGTAKRDLQDAAKDEALRQSLLESQKERSENVMIVDLVRNDLSRVAAEGTVQVSELFGLYRFPQVHQMISTIQATLDPAVHWVDAIKACFPMGSMTGAPKKKVMEIIDETEPGARGLFSGSIGFITPEADFDFNVVIRSIFLDASTKQLCFWAGGGITFNSDPAMEYAETMLKAAAIVEVLDGKLETD